MIEGDYFIDKTSYLFAKVKYTLFLEMVEGVWPAQTERHNSATGVTCK